MGRNAGALISVAQAAALLGVHPNTIRAWTEAGRLAAYRINARGDRRYRQADVEALLGEGAAEASPRHSSGPARSTPPQPEIAVLARLANGGGARSTVAAACRTAVETLRSQLGITRVAIYLADGNGRGRLETHAGYRTLPPAELPPDAQDRHLVPIHAGADHLGAILLEDDSRALEKIEPAFLEAVGGAVGANIVNARMLARARREVTRARALRHVTQEMTGQLDLNVVLQDIVDRTRSLFDVEKAGLWLLDDSERPFRPAAIRGLGQEFQARVADLRMDSQTIGVRAVRERRTLVARDAHARPGISVLQDVYAKEGIRTACVVPLVSNDRAVGLIGLYHTSDRDWPEDELALVQAFANQAAVAIANAQLYRSVAEQAARIRSIQDLSARLNRLTDVQAIADAIVAEASTLAEYHDIRVYSVDWDSGFCEPIAYTDRPLGEGDLRSALRVPIGEGSFTGWVAERGEPILSNDALNDPRTRTIAGTEEIEESMLVVPMLFEGRSVGVIALSKLGSDQFSPDDLQTMTIFAGYAAQAFANAAAYGRLELQSAELERQLQSQRRLLEINERLLSTLDRASVMESIADGLLAVVHYDNLSVYRADEANRLLVPVLTRERHAEEVAAYSVPFGRGLMGWAVEHAEPVLANDALDDPRAMQIPGTPADPEALAVVPLIADGTVIGCMNISRIGGEEAHFSEADFELVKLFAGQASIALRNAEEHQAVSVRADTDALTGLGNHGAFQRHLSAVFMGHAEIPAPVSLLMMDLDSFKGYNDRLGHPAGDALLHAVGLAIYGAARSEDRVYRYGGDEFALILPGVTSDDAVAVAERIRSAVARLTAEESFAVTISIGVATYPADAADKNELIGAADTALYFGKQSGGNLVVRTDDVPADMRDLRTTLDRLARAALKQQPDEGPKVETLVEEAARLSGGALANDPSTIRDALLDVARSLDGASPGTIGHGDRVVMLARRLAEEIGCDADTTVSIELAARLHGLDVNRAGQLASIPPLASVGEIMRRHGSATDGPDQPLPAQIVSLANAYDVALIAEKGDRRTALESLQADGRWRAELLETLARLVSVPARKSRRRRREDRAEALEATDGRGAA